MTKGTAHLRTYNIEHGAFPTPVVSDGIHVRYFPRSSDRRMGENRKKRDRERVPTGFPDALSAAAVPETLVFPEGHRSALVSRRYRGRVLTADCAILPLRARHALRQIVGERRWTDPYGLRSDVWRETATPLPLREVYVAVVSSSGWSFRVGSVDGRACDGGARRVDREARQG